MITTKTENTLRCEVPGCHRMITTDEPRSMLRWMAKLEGWTRKRGPYSMEDRCPEHANTDTIDVPGASL